MHKICKFDSVNKISNNFPFSDKVADVCLLSKFAFSADFHYTLKSRENEKLLNFWEIKK